MRAAWWRRLPAASGGWRAPPLAPPAFHHNAGSLRAQRSRAVRLEVPRRAGCHHTSAPPVLAASSSCSSKQTKEVDTAAPQINPEQWLSTIAMSLLCCTSPRSTLTPTANCDSQQHAHGTPATRGWRDWRRSAPSPSPASPRKPGRPGTAARTATPGSSAHTIEGYLRYPSIRLRGGTALQPARHCNLCAAIWRAAVKNTVRAQVC